MTSDLLIPFITASIGALIGTFGGAFCINWFSDQKTKKIRSLAIKALDIFKVYAKQKKNYDDANNEFNAKINISEKRAIVVALHKLGLPFEIPANDVLDIKNIKFQQIEIDIDEIEGMISQINSGTLDNQFFLDIESYFSSNLRTNAVRSVGKKFVKDVFAKSKLNTKENCVEYPKNWETKFTPGEIQTILVFCRILNHPSYFSSDNTVDSNKKEVLLKEIDIGLWDNYLFTEYTFFNNIQSQNALAEKYQILLDKYNEQIQALQSKTQK